MRSLFSGRGRSDGAGSLKEALLEEEEKDADVELDQMRSESDDEEDDEAVELVAHEKKSSVGLLLPSMSLIMLCAAMFANSYALMNPIPYAPFMVLEYGVVDTKEETGFYAGLIMSSFMLGRFLSSFVCGRISDRISRKFVIRCGLLSCVVFQIGFGLAPTYVLALFSRLLMGFFNGIVGAAKAMLPDLFPPAEQAAAMSLVTAMWNLGQIVGTAVGGLLAGFPKSHPYLVANLVGSVLAAIAMVGVEVCIPGKKKVSKVAKADYYEEDEDESPSSSKKKDENFSSAVIEEEEEEPDKKKKKKKKKNLVPRFSWPPILIYSAFSLFTAIYDEAYPLFLLTSKGDGGYAMSSSDIGIVMSATAVGGITLQILVFPTVARLVSSSVLFRQSCLVTGALALVPPMITKAQLPKDPTFFLLIAHSIAYRFFISGAFTSLFCLINNSAPAQVRGTVNGVSMATASFLKTLGPSAGGGLYAWSLSTTSLPPLLKGRLVFALSCAFFLFSGLLGKVYLTPAYDLPVDDDSSNKDNHMMTALSPYEDTKEDDDELCIVVPSYDDSRPGPDKE